MGMNKEVTNGRRLWKYLVRYQVRLSKKLELTNTGKILAKENARRWKMKLLLQTKLLLLTAAAEPGIQEGIGKECRGFA